MREDEKKRYTWFLTMLIRFREMEKDGIRLIMEDVPADAETVARTILLNEGYDYIQEFSADPANGKKEMRFSRKVRT